MSSPGEDAIAEGVGALIQLAVAIGHIILFAVVPAIVSLLVGFFFAQQALVALLFDRAGRMLGRVEPIPAPLRAAVTVAVYAGVLAPAMAFVVLSATHLSMVIYAVLAGAAVGCVVAAIGLLPAPGSEMGVLESLRFWE